MRIITTIFIFFLSLTLLGQDGMMRFTGMVKDLDGAQRLSGCKIVVYKGGSVVKSVNSSGGGSYDFTLPLGEVYKIVFEKSGYVSKFVAVNTKNVVEEDLVRGELPLHFEMTLFEKDDEIDFNFLSSTAVGEFEFDQTTGHMEFDRRKAKQVAGNIQKKIEEMIAKRAQEELKVKNFNKLISEGDKLYGKESYADALMKYEAAKNLIPDDPTILIKIEDTKAKAKEAEDKKRLEAVEKDYQEAIAAGLSAFNGKDYQGALAQYSNAAQLKPNEQVPTNKIIEIEELLSKLKADKDAAEKLEKEYANLITAGNNLVQSKDYVNAKSKFEEALKMKPGESYPTEQIAIIAKLLLDKEANAANEAKYTQLIEEGATLFAAKKYEEAKANYSEALKIKPAESLPKTKIAEIDEILAKLKDAEKNEAKYNKLITDGDALLGQTKLEDSKKKFEEALILKAGEAYPTKKIAEINAKLDELKNEAANQEKYDDYISAADQMFDSKKYIEAKDRYNLALGIKQNAAYPIAQITKIDGFLKDADAAAANEKKYELLIADGQNLFNAKKYEEAISTYQEALGLKPNEAHPKNQIATIQDLLKKRDDQLAIDESYVKIVEAADGLFNTEKLNEAKGKYQEALQLKPGEPYPNKKIKEIDAKLLALAANDKKEGQYLAFIKEADAFFDSKNYIEAKSKYMDALSIKKDEAYPKQRIDQIAQALILVEEAKKREEQYHKLIKIADDLFAVGTFTEAKSKYEEALKIKPNEPHPNARIKEINGKLAGQLKEAEKEEKYKSLIAEGNKSMGTKDYLDAKIKYEEALSLKENEPYPTDKIAEINGLLKALEGDKALLEEYNKIVSAADVLFTNEQYDEAITKYREALSVKQNEAYPKDQIGKIESIMKDAEKSKNDVQYNKILGVADKYFKEGNYDKATELYNRALTFRPAESYPKEKLAEIEVLRKKLAEDLLNQKKIDEQYKSLIAKGDESFTANKLVFSLEKFQAAKALKPSESYPDQKIAEINKILNANASSAELDKKYKDIIVQADALFSSTKYDDAIAKYNEALAVKAGEAYPRSQIDLANKRLSELSSKDKDAQYKKFLKTADEDFNARNYSAALNSYRSAAGVKPDEVYPQNRMQEIQQILDELAKSDAGQAAIDKQYSDLIAKADNFFNGGQYKEARTAYQRAQLVKNEAYPANQILICDKKLKDLNTSLDNKSYQKILAKADEYLGKENYDKALNLYERALGFRPSDSYPKSKIAQINELINKANADDVALTNWGDEINMEEDNLQLLIIKSQEEAKWKADTSVTNLKFTKDEMNNRRQGEQYDANHDAKADIDKVHSDISKAKENADNEREENSDKIVKFHSDHDAELVADAEQDNNIALKETRKINNFKEARRQSFEASDDVRLNNELSVVSYNVDLENKQREGNKLNYDGSIRTRDQVNNLTLDVGDWQQEADLNREDNARRVHTYQYDLELENSSKQQDQMDLHYDSKNDINSIQIEIENNNKDADNPRLENSNKVVTYNNGLSEKNKADNEGQYDQIDQTKNEIILYKENTNKWQADADNQRQNNEMDVVAYNDNLEKEQRKMDDGYYDALMDNKNDIRDIQTLISENEKTFDKPRNENVDIVNVYTSDLDSKARNDVSNEENSMHNTKDDLDVLVDTKSRKDVEGAKISTESADNVSNYTDDLVKRDSKNRENEEDKLDETNKQIDKMKFEKPSDYSAAAANKLAEKYPVGVTEEKFEKKNAKGVLIGYVTRRIVVKGDRGDVYEKIQTKYGTSYLKNGKPCPEYTYNDESSGAKLLKH